MMTALLVVRFGYMDMMKMLLSCQIRIMKR